MKTAQMVQSTGTTDKGRLHIAFELSNSKWKLSMSNGSKNRHKTITARDLDELERQIQIGKEKLKLPSDVAVYSCYEAGRDGFWIHRYLQSQGIINLVVDSASIEVNRRYRRAKTDRIDADKLLSMLMRHMAGERKVWSVVRVPGLAQEDARRIDREMQRLKKERGAHSNRIKSLLILHGIKISTINRHFRQSLEQIRLYNGRGLPAALKSEILREHERYELTNAHLKHLVGQKKQLLESDSPQARQVLKLLQLRGIGDIISWDLVFEFFGWRQFDNVKQVGAAAGLAPTPHGSGSRQTEQGIGKDGNGRVRQVMIELSWLWLRYQPQSALSRWYTHRFAAGGKRMRRVGIVALARKLLVALWKYVSIGLVPEGAVIKL